jgi:hypothetical protein
MKPTLLPDWKRILRKAWSVRLIVLAAIFSGAEVVVPLFYDAIPRNAFAVLSGITTAAALIARVMMQKDSDEN